MDVPFYDATDAWRQVLYTIFRTGLIVSPRDQRTIEVLENRAVISMTHPVVICPPRKLSHKFMAGEALWIIDGDDSVAGIAPYNARIESFSDDGVRFFGAYGPKIVAQLEYVLASLLKDRDSRQALINIWRESPPATKDVPCTTSLQFVVRESGDGVPRLHAFARMRSSDAWLGVPYDVFNFSMIAVRVACALNARRHIAPDPRWERAPVALGSLYWSAASSHLYDRDWTNAQACCAWLRGYAREVCAPVPADVVARGDWDALRDRIVWARDTNLRPDRAWETVA